MTYHSQDLIEIFNDLFSVDYQTELVRGGHEPFYRPRRHKGAKHQLVFAHNFFQSGLHEIAHWCIAGAERRTLEDYGYWYKPDGRTPGEQEQFLAVEVKPQSLEWIFSSACEKPFYVSLDNLDGSPQDVSFFKGEVQKKAIELVKGGLPLRAQRFKNALVGRYSNPERFEAYWQHVEQTNILPL